MLNKINAFSIHNGVRELRLDRNETEPLLRYILGIEAYLVPRLTEVGVAHLRRILRTIKNKLVTIYSYACMANRKYHTRWRARLQTFQSATGISLKAYASNVQFYRHIVVKISARRNKFIPARSLNMSYPKSYVRRY